jgi:hypothetical protein
LSAISTAFEPVCATGSGAGGNAREQKVACQLMVSRRAKNFCERNTGAMRGEIQESALKLLMETRDVE